MNKKLVWSFIKNRIFIVLILIAEIALLVFSILRRSYSYALINAILRILSLFVCLRITSRTRVGSYKLIWVFLILIFPIFGGIFYIFFNNQISTKKLAKSILSTDFKTRHLKYFPGTSEEELTKKHPEAMPRTRYLEKQMGFPVYSDTKTKYFSPGEDMHKALLEELKKAQSYIFLEYFIIAEGEMWGSILEILKEKAAEGVKIRIIYDDIGCLFYLPKDYPQILKRYGIECVAFNRVKPLLTSMQNNRDHRKIAVIDGKVGFTGGINIADHYINRIEKAGHWKDCAVLLEGKAVWSLTLMFLQMWELCTGKEEDYSAFYPYNEASVLEHCDGCGYVQPYCDSPVDKENVGEQVYMSMIHNSRDYLYINTPYLIIDDSMVTALCHAAKSGVDVRIVTPHKWDNPLVHLTTRSYYRELVSAGVKMYEYSKGFIHSKTFISDDSTATVGTINLDYRSLYLHFECGVIMYDTSSIAEMKDDYLKTIDICKEIKPEDCKRGYLMNFLQELLRVFAPLM